MKDEHIPRLVKASFEFSQEPNCITDQQEIELLTIDCESSLGIDNDEGCFFVLKTNQWSIENIQELQKLLDRCTKSVIE